MCDYICVHMYVQTHTVIPYSKHLGLTRTDDSFFFIFKKYICSIFCNSTISSVLPGVAPPYIQIDSYFSTKMHEISYNVNK